MLFDPYNPESLVALLSRFSSANKIYTAILTGARLKKGIFYAVPMIHPKQPAIFLELFR